MAEKALTIAKYIVSKCSREGRPATGLALQKMLYDAQKATLCSTGEPVFVDDFEAWDLGPIIPDVYWYFYGFGSMPIDMTYDVAVDSGHKKLIDQTIENSRMLKPWELAKAMCRKNSAWDKVYDNGRGKISDYF